MALRHFTEEHKRKLSLAHKGKSTWNKGKKHTEEHNRHSSEAHKNPSPEIRAKYAKASKGQFHSLESRLKRSKKMKGELHWNWQGGRSSEAERIRKSIDFTLWREAVFARDNWTCQKYKIRGGKIHAHHIQNFAQFPELRFAIDNGIVLSDKAHREFHSKFGTRNNTREQLIEFLRT